MTVETDSIPETDQTPNDRVCRKIGALIGETRTPKSDLAAALGLPPSALTRRLKGEVEWRVNDLVDVARFFGVALSDLVPDALTED